MKPINVLSSACGAFFMPGFFKCLKANGERDIRIVGVDMSDDKTAMELLVDKYYQVPAYTSHDYVDIVIDICKRDNIDIFFPHISMELPFIAARIEEFNKIGVKVAMSDLRTLDIANSKFKLYEFMKARGLTVPGYFFVDSSETLRRHINELGYPAKPVVVKMTENSGSRGVRIVRADLSKSELFMHQKPSSMFVTLDEMCSVIDECSPVPEMMAMEYLPGVEYTVDLLAEKGKTLYIAGRRNTTSNLSIAQTSVVEEKDDAYDICRKITEALELDGNIGFDFMLDENDTPWLTDLNPRITATIILYAGAGLNLPYLRVKQLIGEPLPRIDIKYGTKLIRKYKDILYNEQGKIAL